jgi:hypothetical protein
VGFADAAKLLERKFMGPWLPLKIKVPSRVKFAASIFGSCPSKRSVASRCRSKSKAGVAPVRWIIWALHADRKVAPASTVTVPNGPEPYREFSVLKDRVKQGEELMERSFFW